MIEFYKTNLQLKKAFLKKIKNGIINEINKTIPKESIGRIHAITIIEKHFESIKLCEEKKEK